MNARRSDPDRWFWTSVIDSDCTKTGTDFGDRFECTESKSILQSHCAHPCDSTRTAFDRDVNAVTYYNTVVAVAEGSCTRCTHRPGADWTGTIGDARSIFPFSQERAHRRDRQYYCREPSRSISWHTYIMIIIVVITVEKNKIRNAGTIITRVYSLARRR